MYEISFSFSAPSSAIGKFRPRPRKSMSFARRCFFAMSFSCSPCASTSRICAGTCHSAFKIRLASGVDSVPRRRPKKTASIRSAASCAVKHFVEATPISGPACV